ncbi:MAG: hypothetical protein GPJ54_05485 [Candidatus Heimdallarchaeota archaeon]|nr:hypothetical protein [Candidatus Heimdallarchaeota archaeon]
MIHINIDLEISEYEKSALRLAFDKIKNSTYIKKNIEDISIIYKIIESLPLPKILEEFIFSSRKYNILIKHDALIRAIELDYFHIVEKVLIESSNLELLKTAIINVDNDQLLKMLATGLNKNIIANHRYKIQNLALNNIKDPEIFSSTFFEISTQEIVTRVFKKIKYKSHYKTLSKLQKRILPLLVSQIPREEIIAEFNRANKYPLELRKSLLHNNLIMFDKTNSSN